MKKIISVFTLVFIISGMFGLNVYASEDIFVNISYNVEENSITVSGIISADRNRIPMTLEIKSDKEIVGAAETLAVTKTENGVEYSFAPIKLNASTKSGTLKANVTASMIDKNASATFEYKGIDIQLEALKEINSAKKQGGVSKMKEVFLSTASDLFVDTEEYLALNDNGKKAFYDCLLLKADYTLPESIDTEENCDAVRNAVNEYLDDVKEAMAVAKFYSAAAQSDLKTWFDVYKDEYGLSDNSNTVNDYIDFALNSKNFIKRCEQTGKVKSMTELKPLFIEQAVLQNIEDSNYTTVKDVIVEFKDDLSVKYSEWNKLKSESKADVCLAVAGKHYNTFGEFSKAVNEAITDNKDSGSGGGGSGSSSGSSRSSSGGSQLAAATDILPKAESSDIPFTDISGVPWAEEAIRYLYKNKIVSGRSETTFAPDDYLTRAELVKLIVFGLKFDIIPYDNMFSDVSADDWYADYIETAAKNELVVGDGASFFRPNDTVTRQDALVILYRAINAQKFENKAYFEDYDQIADYAKEAVDYFCGKGIVSGIGDGIFAPYSPLTRAQAAKILYLIIK